MLTPMMLRMAILEASGIRVALPDRSRNSVFGSTPLLEILKGVSEVNPTVNLLVNLLRPPTKAECHSLGIISGAGAASAASVSSAAHAAAASIEKRDAFGLEPFSAVGGAGMV